MRTLQRSVKARADLDDIWSYVAQAGIAAADRALDRIAEAETRLLDFPEIGVTRSSLGDDIRCLPVEGWLVLYRARPTAIRILRIVDGRRDIGPRDVGD